MHSCDHSVFFVCTTNTRYGENGLERLLKLKQSVDPTNVFHACPLGRALPAGPWRTFTDEDADQLSKRRAVAARMTLDAVDTAGGGGVTTTSPTPTPQASSAPPAPPLPPPPPPTPIPPPQRKIMSGVRHSVAAAVAKPLRSLRAFLAKKNPSGPQNISAPLPNSGYICDVCSSFIYEAAPP